MIHNLLLILAGIIICIYIKIFDKLMPPMFLEFLNNFENNYNKEQIKKRAEIELHLNNIFREAHRVGTPNKSILKTECIILNKLYLDK